jgi:hypothetical protein
MELLLVALLMFIISPIAFFASSYSTQRFYLPCIKNHRSGPKGFYNDRSIRPIRGSVENRENTVEKVKSVSFKNLIQSPSSQKNGIILIAGFESFNVQLYRNVASAVTNKTGVPIHVFTDTDITERSNEVEKAIRESKVIFCSLIFDFIQMQWIRERLVIFIYALFALLFLFYW